MMLEHGGDLVSAEAVYTGEILDMSVNVNPLGPPAAAVRAAQDAVLHTAQYPDPMCRALRQAIAAQDGVRPEQVFCGCGASDVIFRLALSLRPEQALLLAPTFSEYEAALVQTGCVCRYHLLRREHAFDVTDAILPQIISPIGLVLLCSPNNPTGRLIDHNLLLRILARCEEIGAVLAVDECFLPLATGGRGLAPLISEHPQLFLLRAFTKAYAIANLRLGYALGALEMIARLAECGPCWNVSGPAQAAGIACCRQADWPARGRRLVEAQRPVLQAGLAALGCEVIDASANYCLFRAPGVADLKERLLRRGVLIRSCANYRGLGSDWYRTAVRTEEENERFLCVLRAEWEALHG